jgi:HEPN domain-containing protein
MADNRREFQKLARIRLSDARALINSGNLEGAYHLTGLAVECALKACIAKNTKRNDFPPNLNSTRDIYSHDLSKLLTVAKLQTALDAERRGNAALDNKWAVVLKDWNINSRYAVGGLNMPEIYIERSRAEME